MVLVVVPLVEFRYGGEQVVVVVVQVVLCEQDPMLIWDPVVLVLPGTGTPVAVLVGWCSETG